MNKDFSIERYSNDTIKEVGFYEARRRFNKGEKVMPTPYKVNLSYSGIKPYTMYDMFGNVYQYVDKTRAWKLLAEYSAGYIKSFEQLVEDYQDIYCDQYNGGNRVRFFVPINA